MVVGGYTLHLYCDSPSHSGYMSEVAGYRVYIDNGTSQEVKNEFAGRTRAEAVKAARVYGWEVGDRVCVCPCCRKQGVTVRKITHQEALDRD